MGLYEVCQPVGGELASSNGPRLVHITPMPDTVILGAIRSSARFLGRLLRRILGQIFGKSLGGTQQQHKLGLDVLTI